jgi:hypothetical protein
MRTTKIPLRFRGKENHPPNTPQDLGESNQSSPCKESRFWTYLLEDVKTEDVGNPSVTDLQGPPSECTPKEKLWDFKMRAQQYTRDRGSCDDTRISYLEFLETEAEDDLALARMIAG